MSIDIECLNCNHILLQELHRSICNHVCEQDNIFVKISRHIQFGTKEMITDANTITLIHSVVNMNRFYNRRGLRISTLHVDGNFVTGHI